MKGQRAFIIINLILVAMSVLTGLRVVPGPDTVGVILSFYSIFVLPGILICRLWMGALRVSVESVCRVFFLGLAYASLLVCLGFIPGMSFLWISVTGAGLNFLLLFLDHIKAEAAGKRTAEALSGFNLSGVPINRKLETGKIVLLVLFVALFFVFFSGNAEIGLDSDAHDHLSFVRRCIDSNELFPDDSFYKDGDGIVLDPRKGLWHPVMALWMFQSDVSPVFFWSMVPAFLSFFAMAAFTFFALELLGSAGAAALASFFVLLFYRGEGLLWLTKIGFSRNIAQAVLWTEVAYLFRYYRVGRKTDMTIAAILALIGTAFHVVHVMIVGVMFAGLIVHAALTESGRSWGRRFWYSIPLIAAGTAVPLILRISYTFAESNIIHSHRQGMLILSEHFAVVDPLELVSRVGMVLFYAIPVAPFLLFFKEKKDRCRLAATLFLLPVVLVINPILAPVLERLTGYLHYRLLYAAPMMCMLSAAVIGMIRIVSAKGKLTSSRVMAAKLSAIIAIALFVIFPARRGLESVRASAAGILEGKRGIDGRMRELVESLESAVPRHAVILSDPQSSYLISSHTDCFVVVTPGQHCSPVDTLAMWRIKTVRDVLGPVVPVSECMPSLRELGIEYILVNTATDRSPDFFGTIAGDAASLSIEKFRGCRETAVETDLGCGFMLFEVSRDTALAVMDKGCDSAYACVLPCVGYLEESHGFERSLDMDNGINQRDDTAWMVDIFDPPLETGDGMKLLSIGLESSEIRAGDTLRGFYCWQGFTETGMSLPLEWVARLDTDFPKGIFYRPWYNKQYRRRITRLNGESYRFTAMDFIKSGYVYPDQWAGDLTARQDFSIVLPRYMAPGKYELRVKSRRPAYIPNRRLADYFKNEDSMQGDLVARIMITPPVDTGRKYGDGG